MILQALTRYYEDLLSRGEIAAPGWAPAKISLALYINENGELTQIVPTMVEGTKGKKAVMQPQLMVLPAAGNERSALPQTFCGTIPLICSASTRKGSRNAAASALPPRQSCTTRC